MYLGDWGITFAVRVYHGLGLWTTRRPNVHSIWNRRVEVLCSHRSPSEGVEKDISSKTRRQPKQAWWKRPQLWRLWFHWEIRSILSFLPFISPSVKRTPLKRKLSREHYPVLWGFSLLRLIQLWGECPIKSERYRSIPLMRSIQEQAIGMEQHWFGQNTNIEILVHEISQHHSEVVIKRSSSLFKCKERWFFEGYSIEIEHAGLGLFTHHSASVNPVISEKGGVLGPVVELNISTDITFGERAGGRVEC